MVPRTRRAGKKRSIVMMALLCAHCSLTLVAALAAFALAAVPASIALGIKWVLPPFFLLGLFLLYTSPQWRTPAAECPVAPERVQDDERGG